MGSKFSKQQQLPGKVNRISTVSTENSFAKYFAINFYIRNLVSKKRRRMLVAGYDLDMSYITDRLLAMSFPAQHMKAMYRNPLWQVKSVLDMTHQGHYKIYNLCTEDSYDPSHFHSRVEGFPFDDNHVPPLELIKKLCESVATWIASDPNNIAVIHCMAGKGRTGLMVCAYLVYCGMSAEEALQLYAVRRTTNNDGVSIPSQRRYVGYWERTLSFDKGVGHGKTKVLLPQPTTRELRRIRLYDTVNIESIFVVVSELQQIPNEKYCPPVEVRRTFCQRIEKGYHRNNSPRYYISFVDGDEDTSEPDEPRVVQKMDTESPMLYQKSCLEHYFHKPVRVTGDVRVIFYQKMVGGRLFYCCFNTAFISNSLLQLNTRDLDKLGNKGASMCGPTFCLEMLFDPVNSRHPMSEP